MNGPTSTEMKARILKLVQEGLTNATIAERLGIGKARVARVRQAAKLVLSQLAITRLGQPGPDSN